MQNNKYISTETLQTLVTSNKVTKAESEDYLKGLANKGYTIQGYNDQPQQPEESKTSQAISEGIDKAKQGAGDFLNTADKVGKILIGQEQASPVELAKQAGKGALDLLSTAGGAIGSAVNVADEAITGGRVGETIIDVAQGVGQALDFGGILAKADPKLAQYLADNPDVAQNVSKIADSLNLLGIKPAASIAKTAGKTAVKAGAKVAETTSKVTNKLTPTADKYLNKIYSDSNMPANEIVASKDKVNQALGLFKTQPIEVTDVKTGAKKPFDVSKATVPEPLEATNNLSKATYDNHVKALNEIMAKNPNTKITDFSDIDNYLTSKVDNGEASKAFRTNVLKQLNATKGDLTGINDWVTNKANLYFGSEAPTKKMAQEVADILRAKLEDVVDRAGYANTFGSTKELKRVIVNTIAKENPSIADKISGKPADIAFDIITKNPVGIAMKGGSLIKNLFTDTPLETLQKAGKRATPQTIKGGNIKAEPMKQIEAKSSFNTGATPKSKTINLPESIRETNLGIDEIKKARAGGKINRVVSEEAYQKAKLTQEAKKYKSAEEFVKYANNFNASKVYKYNFNTNQNEFVGDIPFPEIPDTIRLYHRSNNKIPLGEIKLQKFNPDTMDRNYGDGFYMSDDITKNIEYGNEVVALYIPKDKIGKWAENVDVKNGEWIVKNIEEIQNYTKSQLEQIWKEANK